MKNPLNIFDSYFDLNLLFFFINLCFVFISLRYYNIPIDNLSFANFFIFLLLSYYFGKLFSLVSAYFTIILKDIRFIGRNIVLLFLFLSTITYQIPENIGFLGHIIKYNPVSICAEGFRQAFYLPNSGISKIALIYLIIIYSIYFFSRKIIAKNIYKLYSL